MIFFSSQFERTFNQGVVVKTLQSNRGTDGHISNTVKKQMLGLWSPFYLV